MPHNDEKRISCKRCQSRKIKCSRTSPCTRCISAGVRCDYRDIDSKRTPISREYVTALENRVASLEKCIELMQSLQAGEGNERAVNGTDFSDQRDVMSSEYGDRFTSPSSSVHNTNVMRSYNAHKDSMEPASISDTLETEDVPREAVLLECLNLFFCWQNPSLGIFDEEEFFTDFSNAHQNRGFVAMVYSMAALGALMSQIPKTRKLADEYSTSAQENLNLRRVQPEPNFINAYLLCAVYQAGKGDKSKAALYSDIASSLNNDLIQQHPSSVQHFQGNPRGMPDVESRHRHMLLNPHQSDNSLGLFLGRDAHFKHADSELEPPDLFSSQIPAQFSLFDRKQSEISQIIQETLSYMFSPIRQSDSWTKTSLTQLNTKLCGWHDGLPVELRWNRWGSSLVVVDPRIASLHMLYHITRISLNRQPSASLPTSPVLSTSMLSDAFSICSASVDLIISILQRYKAQYTLRNAPLVFIQGAIMAVDASLSMSHQPHSSTADESLAILDSALEELAHSWSIARDARLGLQNLLQQSRLNSVENSSPMTGSDSGLSESIPTPENDFNDFSGLDYLNFNTDGFGLDINGQFPIPIGADSYAQSDDWGIMQPSNEEVICQATFPGLSNMWLGVSF